MQNDSVKDHEESRPQSKLLFFTMILVFATSMPLGVEKTFWTWWCVQWENAWGESDAVLVEWTPNEPFSHCIVQEPQLVEIDAQVKVAQLLLLVSLCCITDSILVSGVQRAFKRNSDIPLRRSEPCVRCESYFSLNHLTFRAVLPAKYEEGGCIA